MKYRFIWIILGMIGVVQTLGALNGIYLNPDIHEDQIVFQSSGRLFRAQLGTNSAAGKIQAYPLHDFAGDCRSPKFSPDGRKIAFFLNLENTTTYDVYVIDSDGQNLTRVTYEGVSPVNRLSWDSNQVIVCGYCPKTIGSTTPKKIDVQTKEEKELGITQCSQALYRESSRGSSMIFVRFGEQSCVDRYRGGQFRQIWQMEGRSGEKQLWQIHIFDDANCFCPIFTDNKFYFLSDKEGKNRLYEYNDKTMLTVHKSDYGIGWAAGHGSRIILEVAGQLKLLELGGHRVISLDIDLCGVSERKTEWVSIRKEIKDVETKAHSLAYYMNEFLAVDTAGEEAAFLVRGNLILLRKQEKGHIRIEPPKGGYYVDVAMNQGVIYALYGTKEGLYLQMIREGNSEKIFLADRARSHLTVSPDGRYLTTLSAQKELFLLDIETKKEILIDEGIPFFQGKETFSFSPDSEWIAYSVEKKNRFCRLKLYNVHTQEKQFITDKEIDGINPVWHPNQRALYFVNRNLRKIKAIGVFDEPKRVAGTEAILCGLSLDRKDPFGSLKEKETSERESITFEKVDKRIYKNKKVVGFEKIFGTKKGLICAGWDSFFVPFDKARVESGDYPIDSVYANLSSDCGVIIDLWGDYYWTDFTLGSLELALDEDLKLPAQRIEIDLKEEMRALFYAIHRVYKSYFHDQDLDDIFWGQLKNRYTPILNRVHSRQDFLQVCAWMLSELETMHIFVMMPKNKGGSALDGVGLPVVTKYNPKHKGLEIMGEMRLDPLLDDENILGDFASFTVGTIITEINHQPLQERTTLQNELLGSLGCQIHFSLIDPNGQTSMVEVKPIKQSKIQELWQSHWAYQNRLLVDQASNGEIGYIYLKSMGSDDFETFMKMYPALCDRQSLILDLRYNRGGNLHDEILDVLGRKELIYEKISGIGPVAHGRMHAPKIVILCNQYTSSDGEVVISLLQKAHDVTVIGTKTWSGGIGFMGECSHLPGGAMITIPVYGMHDINDSKVLVEEVGAHPIDIYLDLDPKDAYEGNDTQLAKAIAILLEQKNEENL